MHFLSFLWHVAWYCRIGLQAILLVILVRRDFYWQFPCFFWYTAWGAAHSMALVAMTGAKYYQIYRVGAAGDAALTFAVLYELFRRILRDYPALSMVGNSLYRWTTLLFIVIALGLAWSAPAAGPGKLMATFFVLQRTVRLLECSLLVFLFIFARSFGLSWRNRAFGIALGLGISATVSLATAAIRAQIEPARSSTTASMATFNNTLKLAGQVGDLSAVALWIAYFLARESAPQIPPSLVPPPDLPPDLGSWNQEIRKLVP
jgi:hypothetical protein